MAESCRTTICCVAALALMVSVRSGLAQPSDAGPSCVDAISAVLADISARDLVTSDGPPRNAFIALNPAALAEAERLDRATASGAAKAPLHCLPIAVKDNFDTADLPSTVGSLSLVGNRPPRDAAIVARLRRAGAVIVGKTNMDEFAMGIRGLSGSGGRVGNAYDPWQSAGGSSAGSGVAVGLGFVPLAVGSDNCGSLRVPAVYNGALSLRATYGRFDTDGVFPIGFVNGVPGLIARDTRMLRTGLAVIADGWQADVADTPGALRDQRLGVARRMGGKDLWQAADAETRKLYEQAIARIAAQGAAIIDVELDKFDPRLGPEFIKGFGPRVDAMFARYPGPRRSWREVCTSGRVRPEWSENECLTLGASSPRQERQVVDRIARNRRYLSGLLDLFQLDAFVYPVDGRGGARADTSDAIACMIAGSSGLPAVAFPIGVDGRGLPVGLELLSRPRADEWLVAAMAHFEAVRGPLPSPRRPAARSDLAALSIPEQNNLRLTLGWRGFQSRRGKDLGDLAPDKFRALTDQVIRSWAR